MKLPGKNTTLMYERCLHYLDTIELHAPNFDCNIDRASNRPAASDPDIP